MAKLFEKSEAGYSPGYLFKKAGIYPAFEELTAAAAGTAASRIRPAATTAAYGLRRLIGHTDQSKLKIQVLTGQGMIEVNAEIFICQSQNFTRYWTMGAVKPDILTNIYFVFAQHTDRKFPDEIILTLTIAILGRQGNFLFLIDGHILNRLLKSRYDTAIADLKLQRLAFPAVVKNRAIVQGTHIMDLNKFSLLYLRHYLLL
jgi:hypothetical protein